MTKVDLSALRTERLRRLDLRPPDRPFSYARLPDTPSPHHFYTHVFQEGERGRIVFRHEDLTIARMPWVSSPEAALIFCTLPDDLPGQSFRAVFETDSDCVLGVKNVSGDVVHCMMGTSSTGLLWRAQIRDVAKALRRSNT